MMLTEFPRESSDSSVGVMEMVVRGWKPNSASPIAIVHTSCLANTNIIINNSQVYLQLDRVGFTYTVGLHTSI